MYKYKIKLYPELLKQREGIDLTTTYDDVRNAVLVFSQAGEKARVKKYIDIDSLDVKKDYIEFILCCEVFLNVPTKSCRYLIQQICKVDYFKKLINSSGRLFRGESEFLEETNDDISAEKEYRKRELTDEEALIEIVKIFYRPTERNLILKQNIKELIIGGETK